MVAYDEVVHQPPKRPKFYRISSWKRPDGGQFFFQVPKDFDVVSMGKKFKKMGREMEQGGRSGTNWKITEDIKDFHHSLYGQSGFQTQGNNKQAKIRTKNQKIAETEEDEIRSV